MREYNEDRYVAGFDRPDHVASAHAVTSVRLVTVGGHTTLKVFSGGGLAGSLIVDTKNADEIARRLLPLYVIKERQT